VQQQSAATAPHSIDLIRPIQISALHQRHHGPLRVVCKQVVDTMSSMHSGSSKRQQPHRPTVFAIAQHESPDLLQ
jgi:hypothetical protein